MSTTTEPVAWAAAVQAVLSAVLLVLAAFNIWHPTEDQTTAIFGLYVAVIGASGYFVRRKVTPV
jgi:hypothetical protein